MKKVTKDADVKSKEIEVISPLNNIIRKYLTDFSEIPVENPKKVKFRTEYNINIEVLNHNINLSKLGLPPRARVEVLINSALLSNIWKYYIPKVSHAMIYAYLFEHIDGLTSFLGMYLNVIIFKNAGYTVGTLKEISGAISESPKINVVIEFKNIEYQSYLDLCPIELLSVILSKCDEFSLINLTYIIREDLEYNSSYLDSMNEIMGIGKVYNPSSDDVTSHPYLKRFIEEIKKRVDRNKDEVTCTLTKKDTLMIYRNMKDLYYMSKYKQICAVVNIKTFDVFSGRCKNPSGNLNKEPWHGLELISHGGIVAKDFNYDTRVRDLERRYGTYK